MNNRLFGCLVNSDKFVGMWLLKKSIGMIAILLLGLNLAAAEKCITLSKDHSATKQYSAIDKAKEPRSFNLVTLIRKIKPKGTEIVLPKIIVRTTQLLTGYHEFILTGGERDHSVNACHLPLKRGPPSF